MEQAEQEKPYQIPKTWFNRGYSQMLMYLRDHPGLTIPEDYETPDGMSLNLWIDMIRNLWTEGYLEEKHINKLMSVGLSQIEEEQSWESMYRLARLYFEVNRCYPGREEVSEEGSLLGAWVDRQKRLFPTLQQEKQEKLKQIGIGADET